MRSSFTTYQTPVRQEFSDNYVFEYHSQRSQSSYHQEQLFKVYDVVSHLVYEGYDNSDTSSFSRYCATPIRVRVSL